MGRPAGAVGFTYRSTWLFEPNAGGDGVILQVPGGAHLFRVQRQPDLALTFLHAAPTTGTRVASLDLRTLRRWPEVSIALRWSPEEMSLFLGGVGSSPDQVQMARGVKTDQRIAVHESGVIQELGQSAMAVRMYSGGQVIFAPSAVDSWSDAREAIRVLLTGTSPDTMFPIIVGNQVLSMLNTGFETFMKARLIELEREGWAGDFAALVAEFIPARWREQEVLKVREAAEKAGRTPTWEFAESRRIDFGDYEQARRSYKAAYGLRFGVDVGLPNTDLDRLRRYIRYRHRIVHISPILGFLNMPEFAQGESPVPGGAAETQRAVELFDRFVAALAEATIRIRLPP